jgi:hypothetical protein
MKDSCIGKREVRKPSLYSLSVKSIADRWLPSIACALFLFTRTKIKY